MEKENKQQENKNLNEKQPDWLSTLQVNSWEAELLISALFLYILFQIPDFLINYRKVNFGEDDIMYQLTGAFINAVEILSIGYVIHIITRGVWVANVGMSHIFPKGIDLRKVQLKGRFRKEIEKDITLHNSVQRLEKIASVTYAVSFMCSGLMLSVGMVLVTLFIMVKWLLQPALASQNGLLYSVVLLLLLLYILIILLVAIDFITNGFFRRDSWAARPYYYIAIAFRYLTFSFLYNRTLLTILSSLPRWQAHLIPFLMVGFLIGYKYIKQVMSDHSIEGYYASVPAQVLFENYENQRTNDNRLLVTIQSDIITDGVVKLFVNDLETFSDLYAKDFKGGGAIAWEKLTSSEKGTYLKKILEVKMDTTAVTNLIWHNYKHPVSYSFGFITYLDVSGLSPGEHALRVALDTTAMDSRQIDYLNKLNPPRIIQANIPFYVVK